MTIKLTKAEGEALDKALTVLFRSGVCQLLSKADHLALNRAARKLRKAA